MNEREALRTTALRAVETVDRDGHLWTGDDRAWASHSAAEIVGEGASPGAFVACRARLAFERLRRRDEAFVAAVDGLRWRTWIGTAVVVLAFLAGVVIDHLGGGQRINLLAPPILGLLAWNLAVYLWTVLSALRHRTRREPAGRTVRRILVRLASGMHGRLCQRGLRLPMSVLVRLVGDWSAIATPLYAARAARILHLAAAMFACGVVAGFYFRGLAFEYRAGWESTFLGSEAVHRLLALLLAPGVWLAGQPLPGVEALDTIRFGVSPPTGSAAPWLHRLAATIVVVAVAPRLVLAVIYGLLERQRSAHLFARFDDPYFQRLLRGYRPTPQELMVIPYSYQPLPAALAGLQQVLARVFGSRAAMSCTPPVRYGDEDALASAIRLDGRAPVFALFSLAATPEREAQGAFVRTVLALASGAPVLLLVDEGPWRERFSADERRLAERRSAWRRQFSDLDLEPVFLDLARPDLTATASEIERRLEGVG